MFAFYELFIFLTGHRK